MHSIKKGDRFLVTLAIAYFRYRIDNVSESIGKTQEKMMIKPIATPTKKLYDQDYQLWLETTLEQLRKSEYSQVDWENLLEEIEGMTRSDKRALKSLLTRLFEHFLKLAYWKTEREYNQAGWKGEIQNFRVQIQDLLEDSPSLKPYLKEILEKSYKDAVKITYKKTELPSNTFPDVPIANLEQILDDNWFPSYE